MRGKASLNNYEWAGKKRFFDPLDDGRLLWLVQRVQSINHKCINQAGRSAASELTASLNNTDRKEVKLHKVFQTSFYWKVCVARERNAGQKSSFSKSCIIYIRIVIKEIN